MPAPNLRRLAIRLRRRADALEAAIPADLPEARREIRMVPVVVLGELAEVFARADREEEPSGAPEVLLVREEEADAV